MILHISSTPVAGTVDRLATWAEHNTGVKGNALVQRNYKGNPFRLRGGAFGAIKDWKTYVSSAVSDARTIVVHNVFDYNLLDVIFDAKSPASSIVFQAHSPPYEPPAFTYRVLDDYRFDAVLAVAQGYGRFISDSIGVPNVVSDFAPAVRIQPSSTIFVPHLRSTNFRWSKKFTVEDLSLIRSCVSGLSRYSVNTVPEVFGREVVTHDEILLFLQSVLATVDDINTGLFHQTTLEAMKAGAAVFSGVDPVSQEEHCQAAKADPIPVIRVNGVLEVCDILRDHSADKLIAEYRHLSQQYAANFLSESRLASAYYDVLKPFI